MAKDNLTPKQEAFCHAYIETGNASESYRRCYSCDRMKDSTVNRTAAALVKNHKIAARIRLLQAELKKTSDIRKEDILEELSCIAYADIRDYVEFDGKAVNFKSFEKLTDRQARAIESIKQTKYGIEIRLHGKGWTIERLSKMLGFDAAQNLSINATVKSELEGRTDEELEMIIKTGNANGIGDKQ